MALRIGILTISDRVSSGTMKDEGGPAIDDALSKTGWELAARGVVSDDPEGIEYLLRQWADIEELDVVLTTGGTGLGPRDLAPEATLRIGDRVVPGIAETIRAVSLQKTHMAMLSRGVAVVRGRTLIINLPGSPSGAREGTEIVLPVLEHAVTTLRGAKH